jgi:predicted cupin superfamily sugar epimerase
MKRICLTCAFAAILAAHDLAAAPAARPAAAALIKYFHMEQIPQEGPWFTLTYRSADVLAANTLPERYVGARVVGSAIIGIVTRIDFSALHQVATDEIWHFYGGDPLQLLVLQPDGTSESVILGPDVLHGQHLQYMVPHGAWQGAIPLGREPGSYTLFGNTLAPGFDYKDLQMGYRDELQRKYPQQATAIARLTRKEFAAR